MRNLLLLTQILILIGCNVPENKYKNVTSSKKDINFYELIDIKFNDGPSEGKISIPNFLKKIKPIEKNNIFHYSYFNDKSGYLITIEKLKSRSTQEISDKQYIDISNNWFQNDMKGSLSEIGRVLSPTMRNVKVVQFEGNLTINNKYFLKRVSLYEDKRFDGTILEGVNCTNFHFVTLHNKTKYSFNINYFGDNKSVSELVGLFNTIGGSINFD